MRTFYIEPDNKLFKLYLVRDGNIHSAMTGIDKSQLEAFGRQWAQLGIRPDLGTSEAPLDPLT